MRKRRTLGKTAAVGAAFGAALGPGVGTASAAVDPNVQRSYSLFGHQVAYVQFQPRDGHGGDEYLYVDDPADDNAAGGMDYLGYIAPRS